MLEAFRRAQAASFRAANVNSVAKGAMGTIFLQLRAWGLLIIERKTVRVVGAKFTNSASVWALLLDFKPELAVGAVFLEHWARGGFAPDGQIGGRLVSAVRISFFTVTAGTVCAFAFSLTMH